MLRWFGIILIILTDFIFHSNRNKISYLRVNKKDYYSYFSLHTAFIQEEQKIRERGKRLILTYASFVFH